MNFEKLLGWKVFKTTITIQFSLLQVCPSLLLLVFAVSFIPSFNYLSGYFRCSTQCGGSCHCLNFHKFPDTAPLSFLHLHTNMIDTYLLHKFSCYMAPGGRVFPANHTDLWLASSFSQTHTAHNEAWLRVIRTNGNTSKGIGNKENMMIQKENRIY